MATTISVTAGVWTDLGLGPIAVEIDGTANAYLAIADTQPGASALGQLATQDQGPIPFPTIAHHVWARAASGSATLVVTSIAAVAAATQVTPVDRSGATAATPNSFTSLAAANPARQFLQVSNTAAAGTLYVYLLATGGAAAKAIPLAPAATLTLDYKVPVTGLQVAGSAASMTYACFDG